MPTWINPRSHNKIKTTKINCSIVLLLQLFLQNAIGFIFNFLLFLVYDKSMDLFLNFTAIVLLATVLSIVMRLLRQPLVLGFILTGILIGPHAFHFLQTKEYIELFSKIGITILLFIVGLNLSPQVIKEVGKVSLWGGLGQIVIAALVGFVIALFLGIGIVPALYIGLAVTFSSTIIILKMLSDKGDLPKLHGKITVGILLVQDLVAIVTLVFISSFASTQSSSLSMTLIILFTKAVSVGVIIYLISKYLLQFILSAIAESSELLFLFSVAWGLGLASIFYLLGFSVEVGALLAGVSLSVTPFADGIASRLKPLRDFFIILFFILLGSEMVLSSLQYILVPALILSLFVILGKPLIVFLLLNLMGYKTRQGFYVGVSLGQVSEFSLIVIALGLQVGHIHDDVVSLITLTALITIAISSYLIGYAEKIYPKISSFLKAIELNKQTNAPQPREAHHELVLFGYDRVGHDFVDAFSKLDKEYLVVDYNPSLIRQLESANMPFKYGDVEDVEFLQEMQLQHIKLCVSTIPNVKINSLLIQTVRAVNKDAIIIVRTGEVEDAKKLYELGATYVVMPHYLGAQYATNMISRLGLDAKGFAEEREKHLKHIHKK